jgi:hypothetical protein
VFGKLPLLFQGWDDHKLTLWKSAGSKHLSSIVLLDKNIQGMNIESLLVWFVNPIHFTILHRNEDFSMLDYLLCPKSSLEMMAGIKAGSGGKSRMMDKS